jgi:enoyl-[acyl-carrier-protein] reductase (NADH)
VGRVVAGLVSGFLPYATGNVIEVDGGLHLRAF